MTSRDVNSLREEGKGDDDEDEDLDTFLTTMESKLRGPFSSLDLAKAVTTNALRGSHTPTQYLQNLSKVLSRTDKVIQSRILIGLLGLEESSSSSSSGGNTAQGEDNVNFEIYRILQQAQETPKHEKWVRVIAGLIQGIMFEEEADAESAKATDFAFHRSCRGPEATKLLEELCDDVYSSVKEGQNGEVDPSKCPDLNASFVPFRYSLLSEELIRPLVPECSSTSKNPHFQVNDQASILQLDDQLEAQRAKEEMEHQGPILMKTKMSGSTIHGSNASNARGAAAKAATTLPPGFRPTKIVSTPSQKAKTVAAAAAATTTNGTGGSRSSSSSSMFMPKKTNPLLAQRQKQQLQQKTVLRRKGAAQSLVNKTKVKSRTMTASNGNGAATATGGDGPNITSPSGSMTAMASSVRARTGGKFGMGGAAMAGRSKMKMVDVDEGNALTKQHEEAAASATLADGNATSRNTKKRRLQQQDDPNGIADKKTKIEASATPSAAMEDHQLNETSNAPAPTEPAPAPATSEPAVSTNGAPSSQEQQQAGGEEKQHQGEEEEWKTMLKERSNKLSDEDRQRVQQFFQQRYNPTPDQSIYKMKLHEQRTNDPTTGQAVKETFYLELDYTNFSSKQSRKVKRY